ncbi:MAG: protein kinase [Acidobacteriota bacterium]
MLNGEHLGPYEVLAKLGEGGMGEVYRARDAKLNRDVAIKILPEALAADPAALARFEREAQAVAALSHPNILSIFDFGREGATAYAVMELLEGETLRARLSQGALPPRKAIDLAVQIADGLAAAHEKGIVHRDLKPENIFVTGEGRAKILDFGVAKRAGGPGEGGANAETRVAQTGQGTVLGTVGYMSPEQVRGEAVDHRSDLFVFGAVLYEMLAGRRAFHGATPADTASAILKEDPPDISAATTGSLPTLQRIVQHCLEKKPAERFQSARDVAFALQAFSTASGTSTAATAGAASPRFRLSAWMWTLGAAAAAVITALVLYHPRAAPHEFTRLTYRLGTVIRARFSPDGETVVYSASWEGRPIEVFVVSANGANPRSLGNPGNVVCSVSSRGDVAVLDVRAQTPNGEKTLAVLPRDGGAARAVLENVRDADFGPNADELAVVHRIGDKDILEYPIGTKLYESTKWLFSPRVSRDGQRVAVFESSGENSRVIVVDRQGGTRVFATGMPAASPALSWSPNGEEIWLSIAMGRGQLTKTYAVDAGGTLRLLFQDPSLIEFADVSRDGRALYVRNISRTMARIKASGEKVERDFSWLDRTEVQDLSADGKTLIFGEGGDWRQAGESDQAFMVTTTGGLPTRLGSGAPNALSPDGAWVFGITTGVPSKGVLYPTGPGQPRVLDIPGLSAVLGGSVLAGGKRALVAGREPGQTPKSYVVDLDTGRQRVLSEDGVVASFDGARIAYRDRDGNFAIQPIDGGAARVVGKLEKTEAPTRWSVDGNSVYLGRAGETETGATTMSMVIDRWDLATGKRTLWKRLSLAPSAMTTGFFTVAIAPEADAYAYSYGIQQASDLFVVKGLR